MLAAANIVKYKGPVGLFSTEWLLDRLLLVPPLLLSLTLHECAHARMALAFGDPTAYRLGRVSLNPLRHLDPIGTLMIIFSGLIGWAKPVPVNPFNLHPRRLGEIMVSAAGPLTNLVLAVVSALLLRLWIAHGPAAWSTSPTISMLLFWTAAANLGLCFFNAIPLFPLDGHHIVRELLPGESQVGFMRWQMSFGGPLLMALILGPWLVEAVLGREIPVDPLGLYMSWVIAPLLYFLGVGVPG
jgi:Zn-dependent protease